MSKKKTISHDDWGDLAGKVTHIPGIANPALNTYKVLYEQTKVAPCLTSKMISLPTKEELELFSSPKCFVYIDLLKFRGYYNYRTGYNILIPGYHKQPLSKKFKLDDLSTGWSFYGQKGCQLHLKYGWDTIQHKFRNDKIYDLELIIKPPLREPIFDTVAWVLPIIRQIKSDMCRTALRMSYCEIAFDVKGAFVDKTSIDALNLCVYRRWGPVSTQPSGMDGTLYIGGENNQRRDNVYPKKGAWHLEGRWDHDGLRRKYGSDFGYGTVGLMLAEFHRNMNIICLDLRKLARSSQASKWAEYWKIFLEKGVTKVIRTLRERHMKDVNRKLGEHPLHQIFKQTLADTIVEGTVIMKKLKQPIPKKLLAYSAGNKH